MEDQLELMKCEGCQGLIRPCIWLECNHFLCALCGATHYELDCKGD